MQRSSRIILLVCAIALGFGLSLYAREARAAGGGTCISQCAADCDGGCRGASASGDNCVWVCNDGSRGSSILV